MNPSLTKEMEKRLNIWMITKWYPNREDPQLGVFIQKHARSIGLYENISVLYVHSIAGLQGQLEIEEKENQGVFEVRVYFKKSSGIFSRIKNLMGYLSALKAGLNILNTRKPVPEIIHAYILTRTALVAWNEARKRGVPFVLSEQWSGYATGKYSKSFFIKKILTSFVVKRASGLTCVSHFLLNSMKASGLESKNSKIIPNNVENIINSERKTSSEEIRVLLVADLVDEIKNISSVIQMIHSLNDLPPYKLQIIGAGKDDNLLKKLASDFNLLDKNIFFEGIKTNEEVYRYLMSCDFLIMNSRFETFSLICAEAMSCGKPVLATRCGGPDEFVTEETGMLIEPGNNEMLGKSFVYMLKNFKNYDAQKIMKYASEMFSNEKIGLSFHEFYTTVLSNRS